jgi:hypothetical protein
VHDERDRAAWFEQVVDRLRHRDLVRPLVRLAERHELARAEVERRDHLRHRLDPPDVVHAGLARAACALDEHVGIGIEADRVLEGRRQLDRQDARPASHIEHPARAVQPDFCGERRDELT